AHRPVQYAEGALDLGREIDVAGRVDQVDLDVVPLDGDRGAVDGDALGLFEGVEVGGGVALIDIAGLVLGSAEVQDPLRGRGLAGVHVGDDADVAKFLEHGWWSRLVERDCVFYRPTPPKTKKPG